MVTAIILASGKATRMGKDIDKCFFALGPKPVVAWSLQAFEKCSDVDRIILVVRKDQLVAARGLQMMFGISKLQKIVVGGKRRQDSVAAALDAMEGEDMRYIVVHDAARPCVTPELIKETLKYAMRYGSGVAASPMIDTVKVAGKGMMVETTPDRSTLWAVQTPQSFSADKLRAAHAAAAKNPNVEFTDDASMLEAIGEPIRLVRWDAPNMKITTPMDLTIAAAILRLN
jgi:2-C-methyl-D-erythritol 4-phosphate cytidylyltransferase